MNMKNLKKQMTSVLNYFAVLFCLTMVFGAASVFAQRPPMIKLKKSVDISVRPALYFGDSVLNAQPINKDSRYVTAGNKIVLTPADSFGNSGGKYAFNLMYILYGSPQADVTSIENLTNRLRIGNEVINQHQVKFLTTDSGNNDTKIHYVRTQVYLPIGTSVVTLSLDDDKKVAESNENNNMHSFTVEVVAKP